MVETLLPSDHQVSVFSLNVGADLVERVCRHLGIAPGLHEERDFDDGEHKIRPLESVRGRDVYLVESLCGDGTLTTNDKLVRVLFFGASLRDAGARRVTLIAPYLCYSRKDARTKARDPVATRYVAALIESMGIDRIVTMDVHNPAAYQNAFRISTELLSAAPAQVDVLASLLGDEPISVVSPDAGGIKRAEFLRQSLQRRLNRPIHFAFVEKYRSGGVVCGGAVAGEVSDHVVVIVDDLISSGTTLVRAAMACRQRGARELFAAVTHGVFSKDASSVLRDGQFERIVILDTIATRHLDAKFLETSLKVVDCTPLLAAAIHRMHTGGSIVALAEG